MYSKREGHGESSKPRRRGGDSMTTLEILGLLNLLAVVVFTTVPIVETGTFEKYIRTKRFMRASVLRKMQFCI